ncbi:MAG: nucleotidyltransferase, partial [Clostridia bacterium]|nr:nucleotidyltransferase [Clostridia bacterium]
FYGRTAFQSIYQFLTTEVSATEMAMIGYQVENTLTENGTVARGVCETDGKYLLDINERTAISAWENGGRYTEDDGKTFTVLPKGTLVSMNLWGFDATFMEHIRSHFKPWLQETMEKNPLKGEYYLPYIPHLLIESGEARVRVLPTYERWYGITYRDDLPQVKEAIAAMREQKVYPKVLWS